MPCPVIAVWENETTPGSAPTLTEGLTHLLDYTERGLAMKATRVCSVDGCDRPMKYTTLGLCCTHYQRQWTPPSPCGVDGCEKLAHAHGLCPAHYKRSRLGQSLTGELVRPQMARGAASVHWRGEAIGYGAAHYRVRVERGPASAHLCLECGASAAEWAYDHTDPDEQYSVERGYRMAYSADPDRYRAMCVPCHRRFDQRREAFRGLG